MMEGKFIIFIFYFLGMYVDVGCIYNEFELMFVFVFRIYVYKFGM